MVANESEAVTQEGKTISGDDEKKELQKLVTSVVHKRKTIPTKCMKLYKEIVLHKIQELENSEVKLKEDRNHQKFMKLVHKLRLAKPPKICLDDLNEAEKRLLKCKQKLQEINVYFKKRKQYKQ